MMQVEDFGHVITRTSYHLGVMMSFDPAQYSNDHTLNS